MTKYLFKVNFNWADEMDLDGFYIVDGDQIAEIEKGIYMSIKNDLEFGIGSNQDVSFEDVHWSFKEISDEEAKIISDTVGDSQGFAEKFADWALDWEDFV